VFDGLVGDVDRTSSAHLIERLVEIVPRPWAEYGRSGKPLTQNKLARLLRPLHIASEQIRFGSGDNCKGYYRHAFEEVWDRPFAGSASTSSFATSRAAEKSLSFSSAV
jgi:hypothetical protein